MGGGWIVPAGVTAFWVAMMSSLVVHEILPARIRAENALIEPEILALQWTDIHEWGWIRRGGEDLGAMALTLTQNRADSPREKGQAGYRVVQNIEVMFPVGLLRQPLEVRLTLDLTPDFQVSRFVGAIVASLFELECAGFVHDDVLYYHLARPNHAPVFGAQRLRRPLSLMAAIRPMITRHFNLHVGETYSINVLDPIAPMAVASMRNGQAAVTVAAEETIEVDGEKIETFRLDTTFAGITKSSWVDKRGVTLRRELFQAMVLERGSKPAILIKYPNLDRIRRIPDFDVALYQERAKAAEENAPEAGNGMGIESIIPALLGGS
ncbi:MAG TPA: hypothetical protein VM492_11410 [Sumerlaeia bacterium]|nr:hypothetical protein [Sumerlaeia bacterium]